MQLTAFTLIVFICLQCLVNTSESTETVDQCITIKKLYENCLPCRPIQQSQYCDCTILQPMQDCLEFHQAGYKKSGIYRLSGPGVNKTNVFCDQATDEGGWTIMLRRQDGSLDFNNNWNGYKHGFGTLTGEFWLGNEIVHDLTKSSMAPKGSDLLINMRILGHSLDISIKYGIFTVGDEASR